jgi:diguanylate cyclase (GGDEF)-like protein
LFDNIIFKRNALISLTFVTQVVTLSIFFLSLEHIELNFPVLLLSIISITFLISLSYSLGLLVFVTEFVLLLIFLVIIKYPGKYLLSYFFLGGMLGLKLAGERRNNSKKINALFLELEAVQEKINENQNQYLGLVKINEALEKKIFRFTNLRKFAEEIIANLNLDELLEIISSNAIEIMGKGEVCLIYLYDRDKDSLYLANSYLISPKIKIRAKAGDPTDYWVFRQRKRLLITDILRDFRFDAEEIFSYGREFRSLISAPISSRGRFLGLIRIDSIQPEEFNVDDLRLLDFIANLSAVAIDNAFLFRRMEELATHDSLTELYLRREFMRLVEEQLARGDEEIFGFLMLDIDDFKNCNDTYGHLAGDLLLKNISRVIKAHLVENEFACRYGGEEFLVFMRGKDRQQLVDRGELIRKAIQESSVRVRRQIIKITVSLGLAIYPHDGHNLTSILELADNRLYKAKTMGKNRLIYE